MSQEIKPIAVKDLVLWTENPRDPIDPSRKDQDVVERALDDKFSKWNLAKLAREMGPDYDFSELPTVVYQRSRPIVYDGNRRIILAKLKHGYIQAPYSEKLRLPDIPKEIPCNVCSEDVALQHVLRKHSVTGTWAPLERDIFLNKFMRQPKSPFLVLEESTRLISSRPLLNQGFVRDEILTDEGLQQLGFVTKGDQLLSVHNLSEAKTILSDIATKIENKNITTRTNRRKAFSVLEPEVRTLIEKNRKKKFRPTAMSLRGAPPIKTAIRQSRRVAPIAAGLFGGSLYLKPGVVSNLYRDIADLYRFYLDNRATVSASFPAIIRMALRLLCETAASDRSETMRDYLSANFEAAKARLSQDDKTTLANQNVRKETIDQLLHTGSHSYKVALNFDQTIAVSLILGAILTRTHGKPR
jgi:hypothetical protein